jgi:hypothetical protein
VNYVTKVAAKSMDKKASETGILINASSLIRCYPYILEHHGFRDEAISARALAHYNSYPFMRAAIPG